MVLPGYERVEYWSMLILCMLLRRRRAVFCDSTGNDQPKKYFWEGAGQTFFFRRCDGIFCYGIRSKEYIQGYGVDESKIYYRCQAAALPPGYEAAAVLEYHERRRSEKPRLVSLFIGRLSVEKGIDDLLEAFRRVREQLPDARLDIVGSGPLEGELSAWTKRAGLDSAVAFLGSKSPEEIGQLLIGSSVMILPSHREPWGLVVNEALSYGCPVVASDICGCVPGLVLEGITGYSYPAGDIAALHSAMISAQNMPAPAAARNCLEVISRYTPDLAAAEILRGCVRMLESRC